MPSPKSFEQIAAEGRAQKEQELKDSNAQANRAAIKEQRQRKRDDSSRDLRLGKQTARGLGSTLFGGLFAWVVISILVALLIFLAASMMFEAALAAGLLLFLFPARNKFHLAAGKKELAWLESLPFQTMGYREALSVPTKFMAGLKLQSPTLVLDFVGQSPQKQTLQDALSMVAPGCEAHPFDPESEPRSEPAGLDTDIEKKEGRWLITKLTHNSSWHINSGFMPNLFPASILVTWFHSFVDKLLLPLSSSHPIATIELRFLMIFRGSAKERDSVLTLQNNEWTPRQ